MGNTYFRFKKFTVHQPHAALKVCTDSCLFGAWVADLIKRKILEKPETVLDIGTGTGLLSLMLAQATTAIIHAVEKDENSYNDANENFNESPWSQYLQAFYADINTWRSSLYYDLIICNPPFFENDLLPVHEKKSGSTHSNTFTLKNLLSVSNTLINNNGTLAVLLPFKRSTEFIHMIREQSWFVIMQMNVKQTTEHAPFRSMFILQKEKKEILKSELAIKDNSNGYTNTFVDLLKDYYLNL